MHEKREKVEPSGTLEAKHPIKLIMDFVPVFCRTLSILS